MAKRTAYGLNEIRKLINIEEKELVTTVTATAINNTGVVSPISRIAQGTDYIQRIGNSIKMQRIEVRCRLFQHASATQTVVRCSLVRDLDGAGTIPTTADIYESVGAVSAPLTQFDFLNRKRFSVLYDELITLDIGQGTTQAFTLDMPHEGHVLYLGSTAAAASDGKGSLYLCFLSDEATNTPTFAFSTRIVFTDD